MSIISTHEHIVAVGISNVPVQSENTTIDSGPPSSQTKVNHKYLRRSCNRIGIAIKIPMMRPIESYFQIWRKIALGVAHTEFPFGRKILRFLFLLSMGSTLSCSIQHFPISALVHKRTKEAILFLQKLTWMIEFHLPEVCQRFLRFSY